MADQTKAPPHLPVDPPVPASPPANDAAYRSAPLFRRFFRDYLRPQIWLLSAAFAFLVVEGSTLGLLSYMLEPLFDRVFGAGNSSALLWVGLGILGLFVLRAFTSICGRMLVTQANRAATAMMQRDMVTHILNMDGRFFQDYPPGALLERVQGDTGTALSATQDVVMGVGRDVVALIGLFAVAIAIDPWWTLATLVAVPLLILPAAVMRRYISKKARTLREQSALRSTRLDEIFHGIQTIKLNRMEHYQSSRFAAILKSIVRAEVRFASGRAFLPALVDVVTGVGFFAVLMLGGAQVAAGTRTTGEFMAFFTAMALTFQPIRRLSDLAGLWQMAQVALERFYRLMDITPTLTRPAQSTALPPAGAPGIVFSDVTLSYTGRPALNHLSFEAPAGKVTALVGPSGAGKTTVFQVLTALAEPQSGRVSIGGIDVGQMSLPDQRGLFAVVTQDSALFDESLRENLILGRAGISDERLQTALHHANLRDFLEGLPAGLETPAGPRGSALSGGQRQRIAIARALLADAPVLLLDEATSALDAASEQAVTEALKVAQQGRTTLVIAHRLATVRDADLIVVMDQGQVVEQGTHEALLAQGGLYARLHALQLRD